MIIWSSEHDSYYYVVLHSCKKRKGGRWHRALASGLFAKLNQQDITYMSWKYIWKFYEVLAYFHKTSNGPCARQT